MKKLKRLNTGILPLSLYCIRMLLGFLEGILADKKYLLDLIQRKNWKKEKAAYILLVIDNREESFL